MRTAGFVQWYRNPTEVAPCVALTPMLHLRDVEAASLRRLFRVATTGRERAQRDVSPPPSPSLLLLQRISILQQVDGFSLQSLLYHQ